MSLDRSCKRNSSFYANTCAVLELRPFWNFYRTPYRWCFSPLNESFCVCTVDSYCQKFYLKSQTNVWLIVVEQKDEFSWHTTNITGERFFYVSSSMRVHFTRWIEWFATEIALNEPQQFSKWILFSFLFSIQSNFFTWNGVSVLCAVFMWYFKWQFAVNFFEQIWHCAW